MFTPIIFSVARVTPADKPWAREMRPLLIWMIGCKNLRESEDSIRLSHPRVSSVQIVPKKYRQPSRRTKRSKKSRLRRHPANRS